MAAVTFTVKYAMVACGCDDHTLNNSQLIAVRIAADIFDDNFESGVDISYSNLDEDLKSYSALTVANGQICLNPRTKKNIRAYIQWTRDKFRRGKDPTIVAFPVADAQKYIKRQKIHEAWVKKSKSMAEVSTPAQFSSTTK